MSVARLWRGSSARPTAGHETSPRPLTRLRARTGSWTPDPVTRPAGRIAAAPLRSDTRTDRTRVQFSPAMLS
eukprot:8640549-Lingulodinium_polyedra.AAC.1